MDGFLRKQTHWTHKIQMEHLGFSEELTHRNTYVELRERPDIGKTKQTYN